MLRPENLQAISERSACIPASVVDPPRNPRRLPPFCHVIPGSKYGHRIDGCLQSCFIYSLACISSTCNISLTLKTAK